ncbi:MAG: transcription elongation factor Spt5 [Candidatus Aenigmatarchaeota archaeon]
MIYTIRTTSGREEIVMDMINNRVKADRLKITSISHPAELKGYIFIEGPIEEIKKAVQGVMHVKGLIEKPVTVSEIQRYFEMKKAKLVVNIGDIVEIVGGPFKGEKGRVQRVDSVKDEVTIELLEASIPIPVTISIELLKLIKREKQEIGELQTEWQETTKETKLENV